MEYQLNISDPIYLNNRLHDALLDIYKFTIYNQIRGRYNSEEYKEKLYSIDDYRIRKDMWDLIDSEVINNEINRYLYQILIELKRQEEELNYNEERGKK